MITREDFIKGIAVLYGVGLSQRDDWELNIWYAALVDERVKVDEMTHACTQMVKKHQKFFETDNIPATILGHVRGSREASRARKQLAEADRKRHELKFTLDSWGKGEEREVEIERVKKMLREAMK
jgi:hypothetical protein